VALPQTPGKVISGRNAVEQKIAATGRLFLILPDFQKNRKNFSNRPVEENQLFFCPIFLILLYSE
jgi:hypothetical protein